MQTNDVVLHAELPGIAYRSWKTAEALGWHQEENSLESAGLLFGSEISEVLEDFRNGHPISSIYYEDTPEGRKPCGIPTELADIAIRVYDTMGDILRRQDPNLRTLEDRLSKVVIQYGPMPAVWKDALKPSYSLQGASPQQEKQVLIPGLWDIFKLIARMPTDYSENCLPVLGKIATSSLFLLKHITPSVLEVLHEKQQFNTQRPYRHGGKRL